MITRIVSCSYVQSYKFRVDRYIIEIKVQPFPSYYILYIDKGQTFPDTYKDEINQVSGGMQNIE